MAPRRFRRSARSSRRGLAVLFAWLLLGVGWIARVGATPAVFPGTHWEESSPESRGLVIPDWDMVVVRLGQDQTDGFAITGSTWGEFLRRLGAALTTRAAAPRE